MGRRVEACTPIPIAISAPSSPWARKRHPKRVNPEPWGFPFNHPKPADRAAVRAAAAASQCHLVVRSSQDQKKI